MNKPLLVSALLTLFITSSAWADKPEWTGKDKPAVEKLKAYKADKDGASDSGNLGEAGAKKEKKTHKDKKEKDKMKKEYERMGQEDHKGLDKQRTKKTEQVQKELGRGSEQGQESREGRRKWWKFWGE